MVPHFVRKVGLEAKEKLSSSIFEAMATALMVDAWTTDQMHSLQILQDLLICLLLFKNSENIGTAKSQLNDIHVLGTATHLFLPKKIF